MIVIKHGAGVGPQSTGMNTLLKVSDLKKYFEIREGFLQEQTIYRAVDGVSFTIDEEKPLDGRESGWKPPLGE